MARRASSTGKNRRGNASAQPETDTAAEPDAVKPDKTARPASLPASETVPPEASDARADETAARQVEDAETLPGSADPTLQTAVEPGSEPLSEQASDMTPEPADDSGARPDSPAVQREETTGDSVPDAPRETPEAEKPEEPVSSTVPASATAESSDASTEAGTNADTATSKTESQLTEATHSDTPATEKATAETTSSRTTASDEARQATAPPVQTGTDPHPATDAGVTAPPPQRRGFMAPLLGGILAAGIGAGAVLYFLPEGWQPGSDPGLERRVAALESRQAASTGPADTADLMESALEPFEARLAALERSLAAMQETMPRLPADLESRLEALEAARTDTSGTAAALESLRERMDGLQSALAGAAEIEEIDQQAEAINALADRITALEAENGAGLDERIESAVAAAMAEARALQEARAQEIDTAAEGLARSEERIAARAALADLIAAAESGAAAPQAVEDIAIYTTPPEGLSAFEDGVTTLGTLQDSFPELARAALRAAPPPPDAGVGDRLIGFLRQQTGARSLAPRAGNDPDALLSRAEAQLRQGDVAGTLDTLQDLPAESVAVLADWQEQAQNRLTALRALEQLQADLGTE